jgi:hypothetical protein
MVGDLAQDQPVDRPALDGGRIGRAGQPTIKAQSEARRAELERGVQADPLVKAVLARSARRSWRCAKACRRRPWRRRGDVLPPEPPIEDDSSVFAEHIRPDDMGEDC